MTTYTLVLYYPEKIPYLGSGECDYGNMTNSDIRCIPNLSMEQLQEGLALFYANGGKWDNHFIFEGEIFQWPDEAYLPNGALDQINATAFQIKKDREEKERQSKELQAFEKAARLAQEELERERQLYEILKRKFEK